MLVARAPTWLVQMPCWPRARRDAATAGSRRPAPRPPVLARWSTSSRLAAQRPTVLVLEDLHWSDLSTIDLVTALARRFEAGRLLLAVTYRPADARAAGHPLPRTARELRLRGHALEVPLAPLSEEAVGAYLQERSVRGASQETVAALRARTRGNPLFLEKVVDGWEEDDDADLSLARIPETLRDLVEGQLHALADAERDVLETASVVGVDGAAAAVAAGCERTAEDVEDVLEGLAERGTFVESLDEEGWPDGTRSARYRFLHDLCQEVLYAGIAPARRSRLHRRIGDRLERGYGDRADEVAAQLASHFVLGRDAVRGVRHLQRAAEQAFGRVAPRDALVHVDRALDLLSALPGELRDRAELGLRSLEGPALVAVHGWDHAGAEQAFERARALCERLGQLEELQWALFRLATFYEVRGDYDRSESLLAESFALPVESERVGLLVDSHELMACTLFHQSEFSPALDHAERTLGLYDGRYSNPLTAAYGDNPGVAAHSWPRSRCGSSASPTGRASALYESLEMACDPLRASGSSTAFSQATVIAQLRRDPAETMLLAQEAIELADAAGYHYRHAMGRMLRGWALVQLGSARTVHELEAGLALARATASHGGAVLPGLHADASLAAGRPQQGLLAVREALAPRGADRASSSPRSASAWVACWRRAPSPWSRSPCASRTGSPALEPAPRLARRARLDERRAPASRPRAPR